MFHKESILPSFDARIKISSKPQTNINRSKCWHSLGSLVVMLLNGITGGTIVSLMLVLIFKNCKIKHLVILLFDNACLELLSIYRNKAQELSSTESVPR